MATFRLIKDNYGNFGLAEALFTVKFLKDALAIPPAVEDSILQYLVEKDEVILIPNQIDASDIFQGGPYRIVSYDDKYLINKINQECENDILFISSFRYYHDTYDNKFRYIVYYYYASMLKNENFGKSEFRKINLDKIIKDI